jgi:hypothetical protein
VNAREPAAYDFAVVRAVPHVHLGDFVPVGVIVHARSREFLAVRAVNDPASLRTMVPGVDAGRLARYLRSYAAIAAGDPAAGPVALLPTSERFHWLTAPRSDVLQTSPIHEGLCDDPGRIMEELFSAYVKAAASSRQGSAGDSAPG